MADFFLSRRPTHVLLSYAKIFSQRGSVFGVRSAVVVVMEIILNSLYAKTSRMRDRERERARESFLLTTFPLIPESGRLLKGGRLFRVRSPEDSSVWFGFGVSSAVAVE